ncbi:MAG: hypothetical protein AAF411_18505 [Myxococcota bacterium]
MKSPVRGRRISILSRGTFRFDVPVAEGGSWAVVHAAGSMPLSPLYEDRRPFAVSMPIRFTR